QLLINVDICAATYYPNGSVIDIISKVLPKVQNRERTRDDLRRGLSKFDCDVLTKFFRDVNITTTYRGSNGVKQKHKVISVTYKSADEITQGRNRTTITQQCKRDGINLQFPMLPCVYTKKPRVGEIYLPLEICVVIS
ncbi:8299_t:CDS:1, partial [Racocetra persica]